ncbi:MAG: superoxide dismutase [Bacteroidetes bacterium]|jgi:Fe-Mn family superoxide dismutase|nr:superoxide dismutase [Bacteroidota bacterium]
MSYSLPNLPYAYNALEPYVDAQTMEIHHSKHHNAYITKLNAALEGKPEDGKSLEELFENIGSLPAALKAAVQNNGGGAWNHTAFWKWMTPNAEAKQLPEKLKQAIDRDFGGLEPLKAAFADAAATVFGSGWAWIVQTADGKLKVSKTANQENPLMKLPTVADNGTPILGIDVWEHAYYLKHQNKRPDYIEAFWNVINWQYAGSLLK